jgi:hypothetical protein
MKIDTKIKILFDGEDKEGTYVLIAIGTDEEDNQIFVTAEQADYIELMRIQDLNISEDEQTEMVKKNLPNFKPIAFPVGLIYDNLLAEIPEENLVIVDLKGVNPENYMKSKTNKTDETTDATEETEG